MTVGIFGIMGIFAAGTRFLLIFQEFPVELTVFGGFARISGWFRGFPRRNDRP
jgi:hypothetical protein